MARSTFYYYRKSLCKPDKWGDIKSLIYRIYHEHKGRYGYRRITLEIKDKYEFIVNHKTVYALMKELGLRSMVRIKKYKSFRGEVGKIAPNILQRDFLATAPDVKWVTDVAEFSLFGTKVYLSPIVDLYNGEVISHTIYDRPVLDMVLKMVKQSVKKHNNCRGVILHSDQGWQYQNVKYQKMLKRCGLDKYVHYYNYDRLKTRLGTTPVKYRESHNS